MSKTPTLQMIRGSVHTTVDDNHISVGEIFQPSEREYEVLQRDDRFIEVNPPKPDAKPKGKSKPKAKKEESKPEKTSTESGATAEEQELLDEYKTGGGWYHIPGVGKVQGSAAALEAVRSDDYDPDADDEE